jgi:hypothetical protein
VKGNCNLPTESAILSLFLALENPLPRLPTRKLFSSFSIIITYVQQVNSSKEEDEKLFVVRKTGVKLPYHAHHPPSPSRADASVMERVDRDVEILPTLVSQVPKLGRGGGRGGVLF